MTVEPLRSLTHLKSFMMDAGYTAENLRGFGLIQTPWSPPDYRCLLGYKLDENSRLGVLVRLFFLGERVDMNTAASSFPEALLEDFVIAEMLHEDSGYYYPDCMIVHFRDLIVACDSVSRAHGGPKDDLVLGVNKPTEVLYHCAIPVGDSKTVLDLGSGCGSLGLAAAERGAQVTCTDINERALTFTRLNARLNGISKIDTRLGDRFDPVRGERFDSIVCNPPFFLTKASALKFTENQFEMDSFVESIARQAPHFLNEGAYFQMLCEWVELAGGPWQQRLQAWFESSRCDVLISLIHDMLPDEYVLMRAREASLLHGGIKAENMLKQLDDFKTKQVTKIYGGLVTVRRSTVWPEGRPKSSNWFVVDEDRILGNKDIGDMLADRFKIEDVLSSKGDSRILNSKPRLSKDVRLIQESVQEAGGWTTQIRYLERNIDFVSRLGFDEDSAKALSEWDGTKDLQSLIKTFSARTGQARSDVSVNFVRCARTLARKSLITFAE